MITRNSVRHILDFRQKLHLEPLEIRLALTEFAVGAVSQDLGLDQAESGAIALEVASNEETLNVDSMKAPSGGNGGGNGGGKKPSGETAGNNLSFPVIWAEGVEKAVPGTPGMAPVLNGEWWYQWGTNGEDPNITPASSPPDPDATNSALNLEGLPLCDDGIEGSIDPALDARTQPAEHPQEPVRSYLQKDQNNVWQAKSDDWSLEPVDVHWIDWGDNLESVDWTIRSQVRTEVVLFQDLFRANEEGVLKPTDDRVGTEPWLEYEMRHTDGWGINEVHGAAATIVNPTTSEVSAAILGPGTQATVYTHCARLTIQKLQVDRDNPSLDSLVWVADTLDTDGGYYVEPDGVPTGSLISPPIFNMPVYEGGDGPGYYSAEVNVKGRIIYGYTWNVRKLNEGAGDYRITFSLDDYCDEATARNTFFTDTVTSIIQPAEEVETLDSSTEEGARGVLDYENQLTYIDVRIIDKAGGGGGGGPKDKVNGEAIFVAAALETEVLDVGDRLDKEEEVMAPTQEAIDSGIEQVIPEVTEVRAREFAELTLIEAEELAQELSDDGGEGLTALEAAFAEMQV